MIFDRLLGSKGKSPAQPATGMKPDLLSQLRSALNRSDNETFIRLCEERQDEILRDFPRWLRLPDEIRSDNKAINEYIHPVFTVAQVFARAGYPALLEQLQGGDDNPAERWSLALRQATQWVESGNYRDAIALAEKNVGEMEKASGSLVDDLRPKTYGLLGTAYFRSGDLNAAIEFTNKALRDCERAGDREGVGVYQENLALLDTAIRAKSGVENPVRGTIVRAQELSDDGWYIMSNRLLTQMIASDASGSEFKGKIYGLAGLNCYRLGEKQEALKYTELALSECKRANDTEGVRIYSANVAIIRKDLSSH